MRRMGARCALAGGVTVLTGVSMAAAAMPVEVLVQEAVQKAMTTDLTALKLEDLKSKIQPIILAAGPKDTMTDAVKLPEFIEDSKSEHAEFYTSLSLEDRKKVNDFYE